MPIDPSMQPAEGTTRRTFLVRSAVGGALVTAGAVAAPALGLTPGAGAQDGSSDGGSDLLTDAQFAAFATPLELAAVLGYQAALNADVLDPAWTDRARQFQTNHQDVADLLATLVAEGDPAPRADADLSEQLSSQLAGGDQAAILTVLADLEDTLAATHLSAVPQLRDATTARTVAQVLAVESQQAALLGLDAGTAFDELTPAQATTDAALPIEPDAESATTTTAAN